MREIVPGIVHWTAMHEGIHSKVSSYYLTAERVLLDPMPPEDGFDALAERYDPPRAVLLTNRHHYRHAGDVVKRFAATVHCNEAGMGEFTDEQVVQPFAVGDTLPGGAVAHEVGSICPDDTAIWFEQHHALAFADGLVRMPPDGPPGFVPDHLMGDDPEGVKAGLRTAFARLAALSPDNLLLAHGLPLVGDGAAALAKVARSG